MDPAGRRDQLADLGKHHDATKSRSADLLLTPRRALSGRRSYWFAPPAAKASIEANHPSCGFASVLIQADGYPGPKASDAVGARRWLMQSIPAMTHARTAQGRSRGLRARWPPLASYGPVGGVDVLVRARESYRADDPVSAATSPGQRGRLVACCRLHGGGSGGTGWLSRWIAEITARRRCPVKRLSRAACRRGGRAAHPVGGRRGGSSPRLRRIGIGRAVECGTRRSRRTSRPVRRSKKGGVCEFRLAKSKTIRCFVGGGT